MISTLIFVCLFFSSFDCMADIDDRMEIASTLTPVGSGARAIGMGGAFIAMADDATSASWNPGGLIQLILPEASMVYSSFWRNEKLTFKNSPESNSNNGIHDNNLNYASVTYPFQFMDYNHIFSLTYQHLYDFNREWQYVKVEKGDHQSITNRHFWQTGGLSAIGLSYCTQILRNLSLGITLNIWDDNLSHNRWEQQELNTGIHDEPGQINKTYTKYNKIEKYSIDGLNSNIGFLWKLSDTFRIGAVYKTAFTADVTYERLILNAVNENATLYIEPERFEQMTFPESYGVGCVYKSPSGQLFIALDLFRTNWRNYTYTTYEGIEISALTGKTVNQTNIPPINHFRAGLEYRFVYPNKQLIKTKPDKCYILPFRCGIFNVLEPAENTNDHFWGISLGTGITLIDNFSFDLAYQYRFGKNVHQYMLKHEKFSQDINEHMIYCSFIKYHY